MQRKLSHIAAVVLFLGLGAYTSHASVRSTRTNQQSEAQKETFTGKITRNSDNRDLSDQYILYDQMRMMNYFLDNNEKVERFDQKKVEITGTLSRDNTTIHVDSIKGLE
jgi:hypothetical protein